MQTYQLKYSPGDVVGLVDPESHHDTIQKIIVNEHGVFYDIYFKMVPQSEMEDPEVYELKKL